MCRAYVTKNGTYTRLCYRTGRRGERIAGRIEGRHYKSGYSKRKNSQSSTNPNRCYECKAPMSRHENYKCQFCKEG